MKRCEGCQAALTPIQAYRGNRFCSVRCSNARGQVLDRGNVVRWSGRKLWQHVVALLGTEWFVTLSDLALLHFGDDSERHIRRVRQALCRARAQGVAMERRDLPWPYPGRRSIRGYRLAKAPAEQIRRAS